jgi:DNA-binding transcriptional LysR family regulator
LEKELGLRLFDRNKRNVRLTAAGEYLQQEASRLFGDVQAIKNHIGLINSGFIGQIRVGYVGAVMYSFFPRMLGEFRTKYPAINTVLSEMACDAQVTAIKASQLDLGFIRGPIVTDSVKTKRLLSETFSIILASSHPYADKDSLSLSMLAEEPFISFARDCAPSMVDTITRICVNAGFSPRKVHECSQINTILRLVENNLGYSVIPSSVRTGYNLNLRFYELDCVPERAELTLIYNPATVRPPTEKMIDFVTDFFRSDHADKTITPGITAVAETQ